ncbi:MAG: hypothetical protein R8L53_00410 [Mariprofundales bacterium]
MAAPSNLPAAQDYSEVTTRRMVKLATMQHPLTTWPIAIGILGGVGIMVLIPTSAMLAGIVFASGIGFGCSVWLTNYIIRGEHFAQVYHQKLHNDFQAEMIKKLQYIEQELSSFHQVQGVNQVRELPQKFASMREVLWQKLSEGEMAFSRIFGHTEAVYKSALDNLELVISLLTATQEVNIDALRLEITTIKQISNKSEHEEITLGHLKAREKMYTDNLHYIGRLLADNEAALTMIDRATIEAAKIKSADISSLGLNSAIMQLQRIADQTQHLKGK